MVSYETIRFDRKWSLFNGRALTDNNCRMLRTIFLVDRNFNLLGDPIV